MRKIIKPAAFKKSKGPIVILDLDGSMLRAVEAQIATDGTKIERVVSTRLELPAEATIEQRGVAVKAALGELKVKTRQTILAVPRDKVVLRPVVVPQVEDAGELAAIVYFQIAKELPFRLEEAAVDFKVLRTIPAPSTATEPVNGEGVEGANQLEVLVGAIKAEVAVEYRALAQAAGLKLVGLGLPATGSLKGLQTLGVLPEEEALLLINVRGEGTSLDIFASETIALSRMAPPAGTNDAEKSSLPTEVVRTLNSYEGMLWHKPVTKILVTGNTGTEEGLISTLQSRLPIGVEKLEISKLVPGQAELEAGFLPIVGLALAAGSPGGMAIDFANPKKPPAPRNTKRTRILIAAAAAVALLFVLFGTRAHLVKKRNAVRLEVQALVSDAEKKLPIYRKLKAQTKVVRGWVDEEQNWLDHLAYISGILPGAEQLYVSSIATTSQRVIRMSVQAKTGELLAELDKTLRAAGYEVKPLSITPANDKYGYNFRTTVELAVPKKLKIDLQKISPPKRPEDDVSKTAGVRVNTAGGLAR